jgi:hypothetical protein
MTPGLILGSLMFSLCVSVLTFSADVAGKWKADFETPDGQKVQHVFTFQVDGDKVTGTVYSSLAGSDAKIEEGSIKGDELSFAVTRDLGGQDVKFRYKGKVNGDEIKLMLTIGEPQNTTIEITAKREKK